LGVNKLKGKTPPTSGLFPIIVGMISVQLIPRGARRTRNKKVQLENKTEELQKKYNSRRWNIGQGRRSD